MMMVIIMMNTSNSDVQLPHVCTRYLWFASILITQGLCCLDCKILRIFISYESPRARTNRIHWDSYKRRFITETGPPDYSGWEVFNLENQGFNSVIPDAKVWRLRKLWFPRADKGGCSNPRTANLPYLCLFILCGWIQTHVWNGRHVLLSILM